MKDESVIKIKEKSNTQQNSFSFTFFSKEDILKAIKSLSSNKPTGKFEKNTSCGLSLK